ncbi:hypothetical protein Tco_0891236 [Tanacetum coccineum]|uniref:Uncharacterized protein n=1 Tax=Tanacetum coccineum TaxID=301880 RepID=A0ABQ5C7U8_9ASTR
MLRGGVEPGGPELRFADGLVVKGGKTPGLGNSCFLHLEALEKNLLVLPQSFGHSLGERVMEWCDFTEEGCGFDWFGFGGGVTSVKGSKSLGGTGRVVTGVLLDFLDQGEWWEISVNSYYNLLKFSPESIFGTFDPEWDFFWNFLSRFDHGFRSVLWFSWFSMKPVGVNVPPNEVVLVFLGNNIILENVEDRILSCHTFFGGGG